MEGDDTPVKRQRTSLMTFANIGNRPYGDAHISPTSKRTLNYFTAVNDGKTDLPHAPKRASFNDGIRSPARASFMSPTRASLARFNPPLMPPSTSSDWKLSIPAGSSTQRNWDDSRPGLNDEKILANGSVTPVIVEERLGTNGGNLTSGAARTTPDSKAWAKRDRLFNTPPQRRSQTPHSKTPTKAQSQAGSAPEVRDSPPKAREDSQGGSPTTLGVQLDAEPQNGALAEIISNEVLIEKEDVYEHEFESLHTHPKRLFDGLSEVAKPTPSSKSKELGHEAAAVPPEGLLFSSPTFRPWGMKQPDLNSSPPAPLPSSPPISGGPSFKPRTGLGPRKLVTKPSQFEPIQPGYLSVVPVQSFMGTLLIRCARATSSSATGISRNATSLAQRLALFLPFSIPLKKPGTADSRIESSTSLRQFPRMVKVIATEGTSTSGNPKAAVLREPYASPKSPQEPLVVKYHLSIDRKTQKYTQLDISSISSWANVELGSWLETEAVNLDKPTIKKTISRYWELSKIRATCWHRCEHDLKNGPAGSHHENPLPPKKSPPNPPRLSLSSFQPYLGQQSLCLSQFPGIVLLINWRVAISPDGSVQSILSAHARFPGSWTEETGGAAALENIGEAFDLLVQEFGVFEAVRTLWGIIFRK